MSVNGSRPLTEIELKKYTKEQLVQMVIAYQQLSEKRLNELEGYATLRSACRAYLSGKAGRDAIQRALGGR